MLNNIDNKNMMHGLDANIQNKIINLCKAIFPDASIWLYGSRARGDYTKASDIDIALESNTPLNFYDVAELKDILAAANIPYKIDIVDFNSIGVVEKLDRKLGNINKMIISLEEAIDKLYYKSDPDDVPFVQDSVVSRFKILIESSWKLIKLYMEESGLTDLSGAPKDVINTALQINFLTKEE